VVPLATSKKSPSPRCRLTPRSNPRANGRCARHVVEKVRIASVTSTCYPWPDWRMNPSTVTPWRAPTIGLW
jgi:hypothetical protein